MNQKIKNLTICEGCDQRRPVAYRITATPTELTAWRTDLKAEVFHVGECCIDLADPAGWPPCYSVKIKGV